ncbi:MAG TPA: hypothetical protein VJX71_13035 [Methylomirabilota bacterium]|nr:hypothetical protein [Methylomirabilota bacterium]
MNKPAGGKLSLETVMKRGALVCVVVLGGVAVGLAMWALLRWQDERDYQAWRTYGYPVGAQLGLSRTR